MNNGNFGHGAKFRVFRGPDFWCENKNLQKFELVNSIPDARGP